MLRELVGVHVLLEDGVDEVAPNKIFLRAPATVPWEMVSGPAGEAQVTAVNVDDLVVQDVVHQQQRQQQEQQQLLLQQLQKIGTKEHEQQEETKRMRQEEEN